MLIHLETVDFEKLQVKASRTAIPWPKTALKRASVNSFGYGGSNAHVIIDEASAATRSSFVSSYRQQDDFDDFFDVGDEEGSNSNSNKRPFTLVFSANDEASLRNNATALAAHLMNPDVSVKLEDLAYTLSERRTRHFNRGYLVSSKASQLDLSTLVTGKMSTEPPRIGFVFTGQGAQWPQMGKQLLESFPLARLAIEHLDKVLRTVPDPPKWSLLRKWCCGKHVADRQLTVRQASSPNRAARRLFASLNSLSRSLPLCSLPSSGSCEAGACRRRPSLATRRARSRLLALRDC